MVKRWIEGGTRFSLADGWTDDRFFPFAFSLFFVEFHFSFSLSKQFTEEDIFIFILYLVRV